MTLFPTLFADMHISMDSHARQAQKNKYSIRKYICHKQTRKIKGSVDFLASFYYFWLAVGFAATHFEAMLAYLQFGTHHFEIGSVVNILPIVFIREYAVLFTTFIVV